MGDQDDLGTVLLGEAQRVHHVAGRAGVGDEEQHILGAHQAGRDGLHVAVARCAEFCRKHREARPDVLRQHLTAALTKAIYLTRALQQRGGVVDGVGVQHVAGAVQRLHGGVVGVGDQCLGVYARLQLERDRHCGCSSLRQCDFHFVVAIKAQRAAEPKDRCLGYAAGLCQRGNRKILGVLSVLDKIIGHDAA